MSMLKIDQSKLVEPRVKTTPENVLEQARPVVIRGRSVKVASLRIRTSGNFVLVADAIQIIVVQALAIAVQVGGLRIGTGTIVGSGISVEVAGRRVGTSLHDVGASEAEGVPELVASVSFNENLNIKLTSQLTRRGELAHQYFQVISGHTVGITVQCVPGTTDAVVDGDVATGKTSTRIEVGEPRVVRGLHRAHVGFTSQRVRGAFQTNRDPAVVGQVGIDREQEAVDAIRNPGTKRSVVEVRRGVDERRVGGVTGNRRNEVGGVDRFNVKPVRAVAGQVGHTQRTDKDTHVVGDDFVDEIVAFRGRSGIDSNLLLSENSGQATEQGCDQIDGLGHHCQAIWLMRFCVLMKGQCEFMRTHDENHRRSQTPEAVLYPDLCFRLHFSPFHRNLLRLW